METISSHLPQTQPQQQAAVSSSSKNFKNWFDEFKAKVSKKSQNNQATNSDQAPNSTDDSVKDDTQTPPTTAIPTTSASTVQAPTTSDSTSTALLRRVKSSSLRARKAPNISLASNLESDIGFTNTILNRRRQRRQTSLFAKVWAPFGMIIGYLIPFNGTLPWKFICLINSCFVIIAVGLASGSESTSTALSFCNGFIGGLIVASACFIILGLSFLVHIMPQSPKPPIIPKDEPTARSGDQTILSDDYVSFKNFNDSTLTSLRDFTLDSCKGQNSEDFSQYEILDQDNNSIDGNSTTERVIVDGLDDEDYKGWMIEFIGDYEQRNTSEIKLKSIFVKIENRILYLCKPKNSHDIDTTTLPTIANQRVHDLNNVQKFSVNLLMPKSVRNKQKYVWSKKYPLKLEFQEMNNSEIGQKTTQLTLFAKSCREKEEWFRRFKRIFEDNRFAQGPTTSLKNPSTKSDETASNISNSESLFDSLKRFRRRSPSPNRDCVQTSKSSNLLSLLSDSKQVTEDLEMKKLDGEPDLSSSSSPASLVRTKSCELLHASRLPSSGTDIDVEQLSNNEDEKFTCVQPGADDSTLTRETAELFSHAIEYSNFIESQPSLDYKDYIERVILSGRDATLTSGWFNSLTSRIFFDVFSHDYWSVWFKRKIQRKLYRIRLPYFMETLTLTTIDLGTNAPQFLNVVSHSFDACGLSIDFDMRYSGGLTMTFETKLNLLKIKGDNSSSRGEGSANIAGASLGGTPGAAPNTGVQMESSSNPQDKQQQQPSLIESLSKDSNVSTSDSSLSENPQKESRPFSRRKRVNSSSASIRTSGDSSSSDSGDSDSDSSSDSSFDEGNANEISDWEDYGAEKTRQNIVKFVDKIASSRYFQHATENRYIKKKLQDISNCPLVLVVQIQSLNGVLTLNVPPPQTDRIWYGFKPNPELVLKALPRMGDREVSLSHVTDWIERKLAEEFRKILVIPNMEDIVLPVLKSNHLQYVMATR